MDGERRQRPYDLSHGCDGVHAPITLRRDILRHRRHTLSPVSAEGGILSDELRHCPKAPGIKRPSTNWHSCIDARKTSSPFRKSRSKLPPCPAEPALPQAN